MQAVYQAIRVSRYCRGAYSGPSLNDMRKRLRPKRYKEDEEMDTSETEGPQRKEYVVYLAPVCYESEGLTE